MEVALSESLQYWQLGGLPRELWVVILKRLFESARLFVSMKDKMKANKFFRLCLVSSWWSKMVYESVTVLDNRLHELLTDDTLKRLVSLQDLTCCYSFNRATNTAKDGTITNAGLRTATNLTRLDISSATWISDDGVAGLTKLRWLHLSKVITDIGMKNLTNLTTLYLKPSISDDTIVKLTKLTTLVSWDTNLTPGGLKLLTNLTSLSINSLRYNYDEAIVLLTKLTCLRTFGGYSTSKWDCSVSDDGLKGLLNLTSLYLSRDRYISDNGIQNLTKLETLSLLEARNRVTDDGVSKLVNLTSLDVYGSQNISDAGVSRLTKLSSLCIAKTSNVTDHGISNLVNLTSLSLNNVITDAGISLLSNLTELQLRSNELVTVSCWKGLSNLNLLH